MENKDTIVFPRKVDEKIYKLVFSDSKCLASVHLVGFRLPVFSELCFKTLDDQNNLKDFSLEDFKKYGGLFL